MKITGVSVTPVALAGDGETGCLLCLTTNSGSEGLGLATACDAGLVEAMAAELLVGRDPRGAVALWHDLIQRADEHGGSMPAYRSAAALDLAVWDLKSKARGEPLWQTLGGSRPAARACARLSVSEDGISPSELDARVRSPGVEAGVLGGLTGSDSDLEAAALMFAALAANGPNPELVLDLGDAVGSDEAQDFIGACESRFDVARVQVSGDRWSGPDLLRLSDRVAAAVSRADEPAGWASFFPPLQEFYTDIIVIDPAVRGITGSLQLADAAYGYELPVVLAATPGNHAAHLASAMPAFMAMEIDAFPGGGAGLSTGVRIDGGRAVAGRRPGHGLGWEGANPLSGEGG